jgi:hypothetical protein
MPLLDAAPVLPMPVEVLPVPEVLEVPTPAPELPVVLPPTLVAPPGLLTPLDVVEDPVLPPVVVPPEVLEVAPPAPVLVPVPVLLPVVVPLAPLPEAPLAMPEVLAPVPVPVPVPPVPVAPVVPVDGPVDVEPVADVAPPVLLAGAAPDPVDELDELLGAELDPPAAVVLDPAVPAPVVDAPVAVVPPVPPPPELPLLLVVTAPLGSTIPSARPTGLCPTGMVCEMELVSRSQ